MSTPARPRETTTEVPLRFRASILGYFRGWRYRSQAILGCFAAMYLGWIGLAAPQAIPSRVIEVVTALLAATCLVIAIFLINDAADRDIDAVVHPERPIPSGKANWRHVYGLGIGLLAAAAALAACPGLNYFVATCTAIALVLLYYGYFKRCTPFPCASELIAPLISTMFPVTAFAVFPNPSVDLLLAAAGFVYFADMAQDLLGGIHDEVGDRRFHVRTFAVTLGSDHTRRISAAAFVVSLIAGSALWYRAGLGWLYGIVFVALATVMLAQYRRVLSADAATIRSRAARANHLGGVYYFVVSAALLPDQLLRLWLP